MATTNITGSGTYTQTFEILSCSPVRVGELKQKFISFSAVNILLSITAILGNSLILVALHKESSLNPPSKLLYRCLATTDLLVGLVSQPLHAAYCISVVLEHWSICRYAREAGYMASYALCGVSLLTLTAISVDRLLAMLLRLRYKEVVTLRRTYIILAIVWVVCLVAGLFSHLNYRIALWYSFIIIPSCLIISIASYRKDFPRSRSSSGSNTRSCSTTAEPSKCTEHGAIQKGSVQYIVGAVSFSCLLYTRTYSENCDISLYKATFEFLYNPGNDNSLTVL